MTANPYQHALITPTKLLAWKIDDPVKELYRHFIDRSVIPASDLVLNEVIPYKARLAILTNALADKDIWLPYTFAAWHATHAVREELKTEKNPQVEALLDQVHNLREADPTEADACGYYASAMCGRHMPHLTLARLHILGGTLSSAARAAHAAHTAPNNRPLAAAYASQAANYFPTAWHSASWLCGLTLLENDYPTESRLFEH